MTVYDIFKSSACAHGNNFDRITLFEAVHILSNYVEATRDNNSDLASDMIVELRKVLDQE